MQSCASAYCAAGLWFEKTSILLNHLSAVSGRNNAESHLEVTDAAAVNTWERSLRRNGTTAHTPETESIRK